MRAIRSGELLVCGLAAVPEPIGIAADVDHRATVRGPVEGRRGEHDVAGEDLTAAHGTCHPHLSCSPPWNSTTTRRSPPGPSHSYCRPGPQSLANQLPPKPGHLRSSAVTFRTPLT